LAIRIADVVANLFFAGRRRVATSDEPVNASFDPAVLGGPGLTWRTACEPQAVSVTTEIRRMLR
jgi:hypothetical protein